MKVLWAGRLPDGTSMEEALEALGRENARILGDTDAGKLLWEKDSPLIKRLAELDKTLPESEKWGKITDRGTESANYYDATKKKWVTPGQSRANRLINGCKSTTEVHLEGLGHEASRLFVQRTRAGSHIVTLTSEASKVSVFIHTELPTLKRLPRKWQDYECVYRRIEPQWFIGMCNGH